MTTFITTRRFSVFVGGTVLLGLAAFLAARAGYYPVALVNGEPLFAARLTRDYESALVYSRKLEGAYRLAGAKVEMPTPLELQLEVLNRLVDALLIHQAARQEIGGDLVAFVGERVAKYDGDMGLQRAAEGLYGMNYADFRREVLVPQAERDILAGRLFLKSQDVEAWLRDARRSARVSVFSKSFRWDGEKIVNVGS